RRGPDFLAPLGRVRVPARAWFLEGAIHDLTARVQRFILAADFPTAVPADVECLQRGHEFCGRSEQRALRGGRLGLSAFLSRRLARKLPERVRPFSLVLFERSLPHCRVHLACASQSLARKTSRTGPRPGTCNGGGGELV